MSAPRESWIGALCVSVSTAGMVFAQALIIFRSGSLLVLTAALVALSACAPFSSERTNSPLPVEAVNAPSGRIESIYAYESGDTLFVTGFMRRTASYMVSQPAHADIQLIGRNGKVLAEKQDYIEAVSSLRRLQSQSGSYSYKASFPLDKARRAIAIRVVYHATVHPGGS